MDAQLLNRAEWTLVWSTEIHLKRRRQNKSERKVLRRLSSTETKHPRKTSLKLHPRTTQYSSHPPGSLHSSRAWPPLPRLQNCSSSTHTWSKTNHIATPRASVLSNSTRTSREWRRLLQKRKQWWIASRCLFTQEKSNESSKYTGRINRPRLKWNVNSRGFAIERKGKSNSVERKNWD